MENNSKRIDFAAARNLLLGDGTPGSYLIRESIELPGVYVLCYYDAGDVNQIRIYQNENGLYYLQQRGEQDKFIGFSTLEGLLEDVEKNGVYGPTFCQLRKFLGGPKEFSLSTAQNTLSRGPPVRPAPALPTASGEAVATGENNVEAIEVQSVPSNQLPILPNRPLPKIPDDAAASARVPFGQLQTQWQQRFECKDLSKLDGAAIKALQSYINCNALDDVRHLQHQIDSRGSASTPALDQMVASCVQEFCKRLDQLHLTFCTIRDILAPQPDKNSNSSTTSEVESLWLRMHSCQDIYTQLQSSIVHLLRTANVSDVQPCGTDPRIGRSVELSLVKFEVKQEGISLTSKKVVISCDMNTGESSIANRSSEGKPEFSFSHSDVEQLINSSSSCKLQLRLKQQRLNLVFQSAMQRDAFCQTMQYMKSQHADSVHLEELSIFVGTWNMGDFSPAHDLSSWLGCEGEGRVRETSLKEMPCDMYVLGSQETTISENDWADRVIRDLNRLFIFSEFHQVTVTSLWGLRLLIIVKKKHRHLVTKCKVSSVRTGLGKVLGNKGCVAASVTIAGVRLLFVCAHLPARTERNQRRISNYKDIMKGLSGLGCDKKEAPFDLTALHQHVFWFGDLNFRVDLEYTQCLNLVAAQRLDELFKHDQLSSVKKKQLAFLDYNEADVTFRPTYKFVKGTRKQYDCIKQKASGDVINTPSWTDRILWRSHETGLVQNTCYGACKDIYTSDHSPVFGTFSLRLPITDLHKINYEAAPQQPAKAMLQLKKLEAEVQTYFKGRVFLHLTIPGYLDVERIEGEAHERRLAWNMREKSVGGDYLLPSTDIEALEQAQLILALSDAETNHGSAVIPLRSYVESTKYQFSGLLFLHGVKTGSISVDLSVTIPGYDLPTRKSSQRLIIYEEFDRRPEAESSNERDSAEKEPSNTASASTSDSRSSASIQKVEPVNGGTLKLTTRRRQLARSEARKVHEYTDIDIGDEARHSKAEEYALPYEHLNNARTLGFNPLVGHFATASEAPAIPPRPPNLNNLTVSRHQSVPLDLIKTSNSLYGESLSDEGEYYDEAMHLEIKSRKESVPTQHCMSSITSSQTLTLPFTASHSTLSSQRAAAQLPSALSNQTQSPVLFEDEALATLEDVSKSSTTHTGASNATGRVDFAPPVPRRRNLIPKQNNSRQ